MANGVLMFYFCRSKGRASWAIDVWAVERMLLIRCIIIAGSFMGSAVSKIDNWEHIYEDRFQSSALISLSQLSILYYWHYSVRLVPLRVAPSSPIRAFQTTHSRPSG